MPGGGVKIPIKLPTQSNKSIYTAANSANNPLLNVANGSSKKQQQLYKQQQQIQPPGYQQISATYGVILASQSGKPGKGAKGKGKSGEKANGGKGGSGGSGNKSSANKKEQSVSTNTKNKFYRISQQQQQSGNGNGKSTGKSSQQGGRTKAQSAERLQGYEEKMSRKVVGEITSTTTTTTSTGMRPSNNSQNGKTPIKSNSASSKTDSNPAIANNAAKTAATQMTSYSKLPVKATKQIKESLLPLQTHEKLTVASFTDTRIPKLFEHYEKIQAIFPEFQPYQGPKEKDTAAAAAAAAASKAEKRKLAATAGISPLDYEAETFRPMLSAVNSGSSDSVNNNKNNNSGSASKPSRENAKKSSPSFVPDQQIIKKQQLLLAAAGVSGGTQRPIGGVIGVLPNRKDGGSSNGSQTCSRNV